ncbi:MAG: hypothetical protein IPK82_34465 [Polyangiaceae bacterium]|nr:hypothetical protein [Polyangiaceae bacterium]
MRDNREKRDLHALDENGMVLCNPRDREAAHRAEVEGIATEQLSDVTCRKCLEAMQQPGWRRAPPVEEPTGPHIPENRKTAPSKLRRAGKH